MLAFARPVAGPEPRIPLLKLLSERAVEGARTDLQHEMRTGPRPPHLLTLAEALAHHKAEAIRLTSSHVS